jgi:hypothetical protein
MARRLGDPALFLRAAGPLLTMDGDAGLGAEARDAIIRISRGLPTTELQARFLGAEPIRDLRSRMDLLESPIPESG